MRARLVAGLPGGGRLWSFIRVLIAKGADGTRRKKKTRTRTGRTAAQSKCQLASCCVESAETDGGSGASKNVSCLLFFLFFYKMI